MADSYNFEATARIPIRPLSYANKSLAQSKEILVDYDNHVIYVCDTNGKLYNITASINIDEIINEIKADPDIISQCTIELSSGDTITISDGIIQSINGIEDLKNSLSFVKDAQGNISIKVSANDIITNTTKQFVSNTEKNTWNSKSTVSTLTATIKSGTSNWIASSDNTYYTQKVTISSIRSTDYPVIGLALAESYTSATDSLNNYAYIYKIDTFDGYITVYASKATEVDLSIIMKIDR